MPTDDPRLEQALHDAATAVTTSGVVTQVTRRRTQRRRNRRLAAGALAVVVLLVVGTATVFAARGRRFVSARRRVRCSAAGWVITGDGPVDGDAGQAVTPTRVMLDPDPAPQILAPPVLVGPTALTVAVYDPGRKGVARSHDLRIDGATVVDSVPFLATNVLSFAEGEGARWALTQNYVVTGGRVPDSFLKRIPASGDPLSTPLPPNSEPVGPIAALGGAVWVPVRDGVLHFDTSGKYVNRISLPDATNRWIAQVGKLAYVTDGRTVRSLDASGGVSDTKTYGPEILGLASAGYDGRVLLATEKGGLEHAASWHARRRTRRCRSPRCCPPGSSPTASRHPRRASGPPAPSAIPPRSRCSATRACAPPSCSRTSPTSPHWRGPNEHTVRIVTNGVLSEITVP